MEKKVPREHVEMRLQRRLARSLALGLFALGLFTGCNGKSEQNPPTPFPAGITIQTGTCGDKIDVETTYGNPVKLKVPGMEYIFIVNNDGGMQTLDSDGNPIVAHTAGNTFSVPSTNYSHIQVNYDDINKNNMPEMLLQYICVD